MRVLVAPDKFKGSLTAREVAAHLSVGLGSVADIRCHQLPLADGGDGSVHAAVSAGFRPLRVETVGPTGRRVSAEIAFDGRTAVVEVANTCGISLLPDGWLQPLDATSFGFGLAIRAALALDPTTVVLALGGSASTDGGTGMLSALGAVFVDDHGHQIIGDGAQLSAIRAADLSALESLRHYDWVIASDVDSPLYGANGAAHVFGPQKGATDEDVEALDRGLCHLVSLCDPTAPLLAVQPGAGAAGGIGFAGQLLGARVVSGASHFLDLLHFDDHVADADVVVTGEGRIDSQTLQGKLPQVVALRSAPRPVHVVVGRSDLSVTTHHPFGQIHQLVDHTAADSRTDPALSAAILTKIGRVLGASLRPQAGDSGTGGCFKARVTP